MARTSMQVQCMQMRMTLPLKYVTCYAEHFVEAYSEPCQASQMEIFKKAVNDLNPLS